jgi:hypothetical protein
MTDKFAEIVADFAKDASKENGGVWMRYGRFEYLIARAHRDNTAFAKLMEEKMRPYQWAIDRGNIAALKGVAQEMLKQVYAETVLKGIRRADTGEAMDYQPEDAVALFTRLPDLWDEIYKFAAAGENYSPDKIEADSGNSSPS